MNELQPGADLDELIATRIMELEVVGRQNCYGIEGEMVSLSGEWKGYRNEIRPLYVYDCRCDLDLLPSVKLFGHHWACLRPVPRYSVENGIAIDQVVEKLGNQFVEIENNCASGWRVCFIHRTTQERIYGLGQTLAHAICLAALKCSTCDNSERAK